MGGISIRQALVPPVVLSAAMLAIGFALATISGVGGFGLPWDYAEMGMTITFACLLIWAFIEIGKLAWAKAEKPLELISKQLPKRLELIVLPALVYPLFLAGYTVAKTTIALVVGYRWEGYWADVDRAIFGTDAWRIAHALIPPAATAGLTFFYTMVWEGTAIAVPAFVAIYGKRRLVATFYTATLMTWLLGGWLMAYAFSAAGPVFAHLGDPMLQARFAPLQESLDHLLAPDNAVRLTQNYLAGAIGDHVVHGGGISAMPSMHVGVASIFILAAGKTRWLAPAIVYWLLTFVGSIYFGYHYAVDGLAAVLLAVFCWQVSAAYFVRLQGRHLAPVAATPALARD